MELLSHYRATAPSPDQQSPCEVMFGRKMRLPFEITHTHTGAAHELVTTHPTSVSDSTSTCRGPYKRGEWVCVPRHHVLKGQSPFSNPMRIIEVLGNWTYWLSDNQVWNARRMRRHFPAQNDGAELPTITDDTRTDVQRRCSQRSTKGKPPQRFSP